MLNDLAIKPKFELYWPAFKESGDYTYYEIVLRKKQTGATDT